MTDDVLEIFLAQYSPEVQALCIKARQIILDTEPAMLEMVDPSSNIIAYGYSPKYADLVCAIAPYKTYINLMFSKGTELPDPDHLLIGTGKKARHIKIQQTADLEVPGVRVLLEKAIQAMG